MDTSYDQKKYEPYKLPGRSETPGNFSNSVKPGPGFSVSANLQRFTQIELGAEQNLEGAAKPQPVNAVPDDKRRLFSQMRQIARDVNSRFNPSELYRAAYFKPSLISDLSRVFCRQAVFMKDFEDDYTGFASFSAYYPYYGLMSNEQLRTYFTWRAKVRRGEITNISPSYAYVYVYELLNIIGAATPRDSLLKLTEFRRAFLPFGDSIDKYLLRWIKDFHIYYDVPPFKTFIEENGLCEFYPEETKCDESSFFSMFCDISKYDIKKSAFYTEEKRGEIEDAFNFVLDKISSLAQEKGFSFNALLFEPAKTVWVPFKSALFCQKQNQPDKTVEISKREIYIRREKKWSTVRLSSNGKQLATYIMKQTESALRALTNFKHKLTADINTAGELNALLKLSGIYLEDEINRAAKEYFAIKNRKVITVDKNALEKIRLEAFETQEKLTAEENTEAKPAHAQNKKAETPAQATGAFGQIDEFRVAANKELPVLPSPKFEDKWEEFKALLTETEKNALSAVLSGASLSKFAHSQNIMPEILTDGINQKAYDTTGDIILDAGGLGDAVLYEDYARILAKLLTIRE